MLLITLGRCLPFDQFRQIKLLLLVDQRDGRPQARRQRFIQNRLRLVEFSMRNGLLLALVQHIVNLWHVLILDYVDFHFILVLVLGFDRGGRLFVDWVEVGV